MKNSCKSEDLMSDALIFVVVFMALSFLDISIVIDRRPFGLPHHVLIKCFIWMKA